MQDFFQGSAAENIQEHEDWNAKTADFFKPLRHHKYTPDGTAIYSAHVQWSCVRNWTSLNVCFPFHFLCSLSSKLYWVTVVIIDFKNNMKEVNELRKIIGSGFFRFHIANLSKDFDSFDK